MIIKPCIVYAIHGFGSNFSEYENQTMNTYFFSLSSASLTLEKGIAKFIRI